MFLSLSFIAVLFLAGLVFLHGVVFFIESGLFMQSCLFIQFCAAPFSQFYYDQTGGIDITTAPGVVLSQEEPRLVRGTNVEDITDA